MTFLKLSSWGDSKKSIKWERLPKGWVAIKKEGR